MQYLETTADAACEILKDKFRRRLLIIYSLLITANFFCLFPQDQKNIDHVFNNHVSQDMTKEQFKKLCKTAWSKPHNFVVITLTSPKNYGKYRSGFDKFYIIE